MVLPGPIGLKAISGPLVKTAIFSLEISGPKMAENFREYISFTGGVDPFISKGNTVTSIDTKSNKVKKQVRVDYFQSA